MLTITAFKAVLRRAYGVVVACALAMPLAAPQTANATPAVKIIRSDGGGSLQAHIAQIAQLDANGTRIEIRGQCASACTMYLGMQNTCVTPSAKLGFHGPQSQLYGIGLPAEEYQYWTHVMADHYPKQIRAWYLHTASQVTVGVYFISGADAIRMGAHACS